MTPPVADVSICLITPVYNDWDGLAHLLLDLDRALVQAGVKLDVLAVNDASTNASEPLFDASVPLCAINEITVLDLRANVGHQFAIAAGLHYAQQNRKFDAVLIMDADGDRTRALSGHLCRWCSVKRGSRDLNL